MKVCKDYHPELELVSGTQQSSCWLHHPLAQAAAAKGREDLNVGSTR
jgi:oligopeptide transport system ATP-binding protein